MSKNKKLKKEGHMVFSEPSVLFKDDKVELILAYSQMFGGKTEVYLYKDLLTLKYSAGYFSLGSCVAAYIMDTKGDKTLLGVPNVLFVDFKLKKKVC